MAGPPVSYTAPARTTRTNAIYLSNAGSDTTGTGSPSAPYRSLMASFVGGKIPNDCAVRFVGPSYTDSSSSGLFSSYNADSSLGSSVVLPTDLTFEPADGVWRSTTIHGTPGTAGNAMTIQNPLTAAGDGKLNWQFWGLKFADWWDSSGNGVVTIVGKAKSIYFDGCHFAGNGSGNTQGDHTFYLSGAHNGDASKVQDDIKIRGTTVIEPGNNGAFVHAYNGGGGYCGTNILVEGNSVQWTGFSAVLLTENFTLPASWTIRQNDFRVDGSSAVDYAGTSATVSFALNFFSDAGPGSNADAGMLIEENLWALTAARPLSVGPSYAVRGSGSSSTHKNNLYFAPSGYSTFSGYSLGVGDQVITTLPAQMVVVAPGTSTGTTTPPAGTGGGGTTGAPYNVNSSVHPASKAAKYFGLILSTAKPGIRDALCSQFQADVGTAGVQINIIKGGTTYPVETFLGLPPKVGQQIAWTLPPDTVSALSEIDISTGAIFEVRAINGKVWIQRPIVPGVTLTTNILGPTVGITNTAISISWDAALDGAASTTPPPTATAFNNFYLWKFGDSTVHGSDPSGGVNEPGDVSWRGPFDAALKAAGISFTPMGSRSTPTRGDLGSPLHNAQGGARMMVGTDGGGAGVVSVKQLTDEAYATAQAAGMTDFSKHLIVLWAGINDVGTGGLSAAQTVTAYQQLVAYIRSKFGQSIKIATGMGRAAWIDPSYYDALDVAWRNLNSSNPNNIPLNPRGISYSASDYYEIAPAALTHLSNAGATRVGPMLFSQLNTALFNASASTGGGTISADLQQLIQQQTAHEVMGFVANPAQTYTQHPYKIFYEPGLAPPFTLKGSNLMPSYFRPNNYAALAAIYWPDIGPWWVVANIRNSAGKNANTSSTAAVRVSNLRLTIARTNGTYDPPIIGNNVWAGSYQNNFTTPGGSAQYRVDGDGYICLPSTDGYSVIHGGGAFNTGINSPETVKGVIFGADFQQVDWDTGQPTSDPNGQRMFYVGVDAFPPGGSANSSFAPLDYAPGVGSGSFLQATSAVRRGRMTTLTGDELLANPPPAGV